MGADISLSVLPYFTMTEERKSRLLCIIDDMTKEDLADLMYWHSDAKNNPDKALKELKIFAREFFENYEDNIYRRDVAILRFQEVQYAITGGMSWGEQPTDACDMFNTIMDFGILYEIMEGMAEEDAYPRKHKVANWRAPEPEKIRVIRT